MKVYHKNSRECALENLLETWMMGGERVKVAEGRWGRGSLEILKSCNDKGWIRIVATGKLMEVSEVAEEVCYALTQIICWHWGMIRVNNRRGGEHCR